MFIFYVDIYREGGDIGLFIIIKVNFKARLKSGNGLFYYG